MKNITAETCRTLSLGRDPKFEALLKHIQSEARLYKPYAEVDKLSERAEKDLIGRGFIIERPPFLFDKGPIKIHW